MRDCADCAGRRAVVQPDVARAKINRARSWLDEADAILGRPREEYLADARGRDLAAFYLEASIGIRAMREFLSAMAREAGL